MSQEEETASDLTARRLTFARGMLGFRRLRSRHLPDIHFADPAWDILLDLYIAEHDGHAVSVSSLCVAAGVPQTTALRWIKVLTDRGLLSRRNDEVDRRRVNITLTATARAALDACLDSGLALVASAL